MLIIVFIIAELIHSRTKLLEYIPETKPQPVALGFQNLS